MTVLIPHDRQCPYKGKAHTDAAKRIFDAYHLHRTADLYGASGKWIACALSDGTSDGVLYDSKYDAIIHQHHDELWFAFVQITPAFMSVCDAEIFLDVTRRLYDKGLHMVDPDSRRSREVIMRSSIEDVLAMRRGYSTNIRMPDASNN